MKIIQPALLAVAVSLTPVLLTGCGGDNNGNIRNFTGFVTKQFNRTSDLTDPVEINRLILVDRDSDDPNAYAPLLAH